MLRSRSTGPFTSRIPAGSLAWLPALLACLAVLCSPGAASADWNRLRPDELPQMWFRDMARVPGDSVLWATGTCGSNVVRSTWRFCVNRSPDGGRSWTELYSELLQSSVATGKIAVTDDQHACVVPHDDGPRLIRTEDGGQNWAEISLQAQGLTRLDDIDFAGAVHGWMAATRGGEPVVLATSNAGRDWSVQDSPAFPAMGSMRCIDFVDAVHGWAGCETVDSCCVYITADGGSTWARESTLSRTSGWFFMDLFVLGPAAGAEAWAVVAEPGATTGNTFVYHTSALSPWAYLSTVPNGYGCQEITFASPLSGFMLGYIRSSLLSPYLRTEDGGATWTAYFLPTPGAYGEAIELEASGRGWIVGVGGLVLRTPDAGIDWDVLRWSDAFGQVRFPGASRGWAAGQNGCILGTHDRGEHWTLETWNGRSPQSIRGMDFPDSSCGYMGVQDMGSFALLTTSGNGTWATRAGIGVLDPGWSYILALEFPTRDLGFLGEHYMGPPPHQPGVLYRTVDGGLSWNACLQDSSVGGARSLSFVDPDHGWAVISRDAVHRTVDGGLHWERRPLPLQGLVAPEVVDFVDAQTGWVLCTFSNVRAQVWHTSDGGNRWEMRAQLGPSANGYSDLCFVNHLAGWMSQRVGTILRTYDGGWTWQPDSNPADTLFVERLECQDLAHTFAAGETDIVGRRSDPSDLALSHEAPHIGIALGQNWPNPFRGQTVIAIAPGSSAQDLSVQVFDPRGRLVRVLRVGTQSAQGALVRWDGRDNSGQFVPSGTYFYRLVSPRGVGEAKRAVRIR